MPRGRKKVDVKKKPEPKFIDEPKVEEPKVEEKKAAPKPAPLPPLNPGQKWFEAPDGTLIEGESSKDRIWYRNGNNGEGMYINPKR